jgi:hypothetical protein
MKKIYFFKLAILALFQFSFIESHSNNPFMENPVSVLTEINGLILYSPCSHFLYEINKCY